MPPTKEEIDELLAKFDAMCERLGIKQDDCEDAASLTTLNERADSGDDRQT